MNIEIRKATKDVSERDFLRLGIIAFLVILREILETIKNTLNLSDEVQINITS